MDKSFTKNEKNGNGVLLDGAPWKGILKFALPVFLGLLLQQLYNTADTVIVGNFESEDAMSAVGATAVLTMAFLAFANGFSAGAGVIVAHLFGAEKESELRRNACTSILLMIGMGVVCTGIALAINKLMLKYVLNTPTDLLEMAVVYFRVYALGLVFQFGYNIVAAVLRGVGDSKATMYFLLIAAFINVGLDILFVAVLRLGAMGAALATDISQAACCIAGFIYMVKRYPIFRWKPKELTFEWKFARNALKMGFPMALQQFIVAVGFVFLQRAVNGYGKYMTASFTVAMRVETYIQLPASSLQVTQATYTGQNLGAENIDRVSSGAKQTFLMSEAVTVVLSAVVFVLAAQIASLFNLTDEAMVYCVTHLRTTAILLPLLASYFPILGLFQGADNGFKATIVATTALFVRALTTYTLCYLPIMGYRIIWWNTAFGWGIGMILTWSMYFHGGWKKKWITKPMTEKSVEVQNEIDT
ncbi:MAG: MATE family efflux transporter [Clostridiales bacterium]|nr:MATE family efflux transporter [Clostridiales bacterium]